MLAAGDGGWKIAATTASPVKTRDITHKEKDRIIAPLSLLSESGVSDELERDQRVRAANIHDFRSQT